MEEKICPQCEKPFARPECYSPVQWSARVHCSRRCAGLKRRYTDDEITAMYLEGSSSTEIGKVVGLTGTSVLRIVRKRGLVRPLSHGKKLSHARPEVKAKISKAHTGRKCPDHVKKILRQQYGSKNANWTGGLTNTVGGYLAFTRSKANGEHSGKFLHQVIAEHKLGRPLRKGEVVHHIDNDKLNNNPKNLEVMSHSEHSRLHALENKLGRNKCQEA